MYLIFRHCYKHFGTLTNDQKVVTPATRAALDAAAAKGVTIVLSRYGNEKEGGYTIMKVLMVEPGKSPYAAEIESGLKSLQKKEVLI